ncbi:diguanylate cyclase [Pseudooctadecabacter jejudonensis]|uniref:diguanylate cyclase n=1 Tax=Pseudooctadecabacter jejudonensis TaxID=1391910 RepID=A0A1Y5RYT8_9RHOB|nr:diguanylate cyclase [Pseudooctadecabacter jejudonensis]SLN28510.1 Response regulator PleD [Pseudooctadecabacter jejudonensis]
MNIDTFMAGRTDADVLSILPTAPLSQVAETLTSHGIGALVVLDDFGNLVGIVSERDLIPVFARADAMAFDDPVSSIMTKNVVTCTVEDEVGYVLRLMTTNNIRHIPVKRGGVLRGMISIRELSRAYDMLMHQANTDPLTELSNRRPFLKNLKTEFARARRTQRPLSVAMIDLDHFKQVNDTYGHAAGDAVLRAVSDALILEFRSIDLVGRLGGEEFAVIFPETDLSGAFTACERLRDVVASTPVEVDDLLINVTASIGIATLQEESENGMALLEEADARLLAAKSAGRNRVLSKAA